MTNIDAFFVLRGKHIDAARDEILNKYGSIDGYCPVGTERAYWTIDPQGNIRPCNHSSTILGNVLEHPFLRIKRSDKLAEFVSAQPSFCSACRMRKTCNGGCKAAAQVCYDTPTACEPFLNLHRNDIYSGK